MQGYLRAVALAAGLVLATVSAAAFAAPQLLVPVLHTETFTMEIDEDAFSRDLGATIALMLPDGHRFDVIVQSPRSHDSGNVSWTGHMIDGNGQDGFVVSLTGSRNGGVFGTILSPTGEYRVEPAGGEWNAVKVTRVEPRSDSFDNDVVVFDEYSGHFTALPKSISEKQRSTTRTSAPSLYNLLILYTNSARGDMNDAAWQAYLDNLLTITNAAYEASGTNIEFNLVDARLVAADEVDSNLALLGQMRRESPDFNPAVFGEVSKWRVERDAHFVTLLRESRDSHGSCGYGHLPNVGTNAAAYSPRLGFSTVSIRGTCLATTLAHELGHNLGSAHEKSNATGGAGAFAYSNAYSNSVSVNTIMATANMSIPRVAKFSSPSLDCNGAPCGIAGEAENARSLYEVRPYYDAWLTDRAIELRDLRVPAVYRGASFAFEYHIAGLIGDLYTLELHKAGEFVETLVRDGTFMDASRATMSVAVAPGADYTLVLKSTLLPEIYGETAVVVKASDIHASFFALEAGENAVSVQAAISHGGVPYTGALTVLDAAGSVVSARPLAGLHDALVLKVSGLTCATAYTLAAAIQGADGVPAEVEFETTEFATSACSAAPTTKAGGGAFDWLSLFALLTMALVRVTRVRLLA